MAAFEWHQMANELPDKALKFVALYKDGSGARLFLHDDYGEVYDADGDTTDADELRKDFSLWAAVPDDYRFWMEDNYD